jgi:hypothetical protein
MSFLKRHVHTPAHLRNENKLPVPVKVNPLFHSHILACKVHREIAALLPSTLEYDVTLAIVAAFPVILITSIKVVTRTVENASVAWSEFLATDPEIRIRFPELPDFLRSSGSGMGSTLPCEYN